MGFGVVMAWEDVWLWNAHRQQCCKELGLEQELPAALPEVMPCKPSMATQLFSSSDVGPFPQVRFTGVRVQFLGGLFLSFFFGGEREAVASGFFHLSEEEPGVCLTSLAVLTAHLHFLHPLCHAQPQHVALKGGKQQTCGKKNNTRGIGIQLMPCASGRSEWKNKG